MGIAVGKMVEGAVEITGRDTLNNGNPLERVANPAMLNAQLAAMNVRTNFENIAEVPTAPGANKNGLHR